MLKDSSGFWMQNLPSPPKSHIKARDAISGREIRELDKNKNPGNLGG